MNHRTRRTITPAVALHYIESPPTWCSPAELEPSSSHHTSIESRTTPYHKTSKESQFGDEIQEGKQKGTISSRIDSKNTSLSITLKKIASGFTSQSTKPTSGTLSNQSC